MISKGTFAFGGFPGLVAIAGFFLFCPPSPSHARSVPASRAQEDFFQAMLDKAANTTLELLTSKTNLANSAYARNRYPLRLAAARGPVGRVTRLLDADAPTDVRDTNGWTPLEAAIQAKQSGTIRLLLAAAKAGAPGAPAARGVSMPLHQAAARGDIAALSALVGGSDLEARNELGFTPLHLAMQHGHLAAAALLLESGADINARDPDGNTALHLILLHRPPAIQSKPPESWLERRKSDPSKETFVHYLTTEDKESMEWPVPMAAAFLLAAGVDAEATNKACKTVVEIAMDESIILFEEERAALMKLLGAMGTKIFEARDANGDTALHRVARGIYSDKVADLIAGGADVNATNQQGRTPLHAAVEKIGIWEGPLVEILRAKPNVNAPDNEGMTPLHVLAVSPSIFSAQATRALLNAGANPNIQDRRGRTAAHLALSGEWPWNQAGECLGMLVEAGADLSLRDDHGRTPLHYLAGLGDKQPLFFIRGITNIFGSTNVDIAARDNQGDTPLHIAARTGTSDVFDWLVQRGASLDVTNNAGETPRGLAARSLSRFPRGRPSAETDIFRAVSEGKLETVATLLKADSGLLELTNRFGHTPLRAAVLAGQTNIVEFLEARGARWDAVSAAWAGRADVLQQILASDRAAITNTLGGSSLLYIAADRGNLEVARLLLAAGSDPNGRERSGLSPLGAARARNQKEIANLLIAHGAVLNIFDATRLDDLEAATELIRTNRWLVNATNPAGIAVAEMAAEGGRDRILKLLLDKGVSVNFANPRNGRTLLHTAVTHNQTNTAALLLRRGAKVDAFDRNGVTPLHMASALGYADMAALLLKHRANPNARSLPVSADAELPFVRLFTLPVNCTALHMAALYAQTNVIELLIRAGADVNATNAAGMTPLDFVKQRMILSMRPPGFVSFGPEQPVVPPGMVGRAGQDFYTSFESRRKMAANLLEAAGGKSGRPTAPAGYRHP